MDFIGYDIILLILFVLCVSVFLYRNKKNLKKEGLMFLFRAKWGMKLIDKVGGKYKKTLKFLSYVSITIGYFLMVGMLYMLGKIVYIYVLYPQIVQAVKVPPIMPLIPYIDKIVPGLPPFYFIYFILILAIIAVFHEFAHGIFMRRYNVKIKSTGFGFFPFFLPVFLAAFVEQDEKSMEKKSRFQQKAILSAGTFANLLTAILAFLLMALFFICAFSPSGVAFDSYAYAPVLIGNISTVNNISLENPTYENLLDSLDEKGLNEIQTSEEEYLITKKFLEEQENNKAYILAFFDAPAVRNNISSTINSINGVEIKNLEDLTQELDKYTPGQTITLGSSKEKLNITLVENPQNSSKAWVGIAFQKSKAGIVSVLSSFKKPSVEYEPSFKAAEFIYNFLWWLALIAFSVALINMLPMGIFDGGRFFYLTILGFSKSKKTAKRWFAFMTYFILFLFLVLMVFWGFSFA